MKQILIPLFAVCAVSAFAQGDGLSTHEFGSWKIHVLPELQQLASPDILIGATEEMLEAFAPDGIPNAVNAFLIQTGEKNILVDTGFGRKLFGYLESLTLAASEIDIVLLTHMHGDHIGGLLKDGAILFPNAEVYLAGPERDYWRNTAAPDSIQAQVLAAYADQLNLFTPGSFADADALLPGIRGIAAYGHTPGHTMYLLENGGGKFLIWGDLAHAMAIQMPHPEISVTYDVDPARAAASRAVVLETLVEQQIPAGGMHVAFPGMGSLSTRESGGYLFTPLAD